MKKYEYAGEMQELCFKVSQACKVLGDKGLQDFYEAAREGFVELRNNYSVEEADAPIDADQEKILESTAAYVKEVEKEAAAKLDREITA